MSFDYDLTRMKDREVHSPAEENGDLNAKVQSLIWLTLPVGIGQITEKNAKEFFIRARIWQKAIGPQFNRVKDDGSLDPILVEWEDVQRAVGLHTNASPHSKTEFFRRLYDTIERDVAWRIRQAKREASDA